MESLVFRHRDKPYNSPIEEEDEDEYLQALMSCKQVVISDNFLQQAIDSLQSKDLNDIFQGITYISEYSTSCPKDLYSKLDQNQISFLLSYINVQEFQQKILIFIKSMLRAPEFYLDEQYVAKIYEILLTESNLEIIILVIDILRQYCTVYTPNQVKFLDIINFDSIFTINLENTKLLHKFLKFLMILYSSPISRFVPMLESKIPNLEFWLSNESDLKTIALTLSIMDKAIKWSKNTQENAENYVSICFSFLFCEEQKITFLLLSFLRDVSKSCPESLIDHLSEIFNFYHQYINDINIMKQVISILCELSSSENLIIPILNVFFADINASSSLFNCSYKIQLLVLDFTNQMLKKTPLSYYNLILTDYIFNIYTDTLINDTNHDVCNDFIMILASICSQNPVSDDFTWLVGKLHNDSFISIISEIDNECSQVILDILSQY